MKSLVEQCIKGKKGYRKKTTSTPQRVLTRIFAARHSSNRSSTATCNTIFAAQKNKTRFYEYFAGLSLIVFFVLISPHSIATSKGLQRLESLEVFDTQENFAVIVGIDNYDIAAPLNYAVADANQLAEFFRSQGYQVKLLTNDSATPPKILRALKLYGESATLNGSREQGNLVFAFSGHGFQADGENYLATSESDPDQLADTALSLKDVQETLKATGVRQRVLFIDACRNEPSRGTQFSNGTFVEDDEPGEGEAILYSTRAGSLSWEDPNLGHGVFTYYLLDGLKGAAAGEDALVTFNDLQRYVETEVKRHVLTRFSRNQLPYIGGERSGEFVLANYQKNPALTDPSPRFPPNNPEPFEEIVVSKPWYKRWYVWVGLLAAALAVAACSDGGEGGSSGQGGSGGGC